MLLKVTNFTLISYSMNHKRIQCSLYRRLSPDNPWKFRWLVLAEDAQNEPRTMGHPFFSLFVCFILFKERFGIILWTLLCDQLRTRSFAMWLWIAPADVSKHSSKFSPWNILEKFRFFSCAIPSIVFVDLLPKAFVYIFTYLYNSTDNYPVSQTFWVSGTDQSRTNMHSLI